MKIVLINPPGGSHYDGPMMGIPSLVGQLKKNGYQNVIQRDLDLDLFYYTLRPDTAEKVITTLKENLAQSTKGSSTLKRLFAQLLGPATLRFLSNKALKHKEFIEKFRSSTAIDKPFPGDKLLSYKKAVNCVLKLMSVYYYPVLSYPRFFSLLEKRIYNTFTLKAVHALHENSGHGEKMLLRFYDEEQISVLIKEKCDIVGVSISFKHQLKPALLLAEVIKRSSLSVKVVFGGSYLTTILDSDSFEDTILKNVDYAIYSEGEDAFPALLDRIKDNQPLEDSPNLIHMDNGELKINDRVTIPDLNTVETPDYDGLSLNLYLERPVRLPLMTCRGCYWGRCAYCSHHWTLGSGKLRIRRPSKLSQDIQLYKEKFGTDHIYFTDEAIHPETMKELSIIAAESGISMHWVGMLRFEENVDYEFLKLIRQNGCHAIMFGLESVSENVQNIINKGIKLDVAHRILADCRKLGIKAHIFIMLGIPGETHADMQANFNFLSEKSDLYETVQLAPFQLMKGSPMYRRPQKYGIYNISTIKDNDGNDLSEVKFDTKTGLSREEVNGYIKKIMRDKLLFKKDLWEGHAFRLYQDDLIPQDNID